MAAHVPPFLTLPDDGHYQSITSLPSHSHASFEEHRLADYQRGRGVVARLSTSTVLRPPAGLVVASLPSSNGVPQIARAKTTWTPGVNPYASRAITCHVGEDDTQDFTVHEAFLIASSEFARTALTKNWKEAHEGVLPLPEVDVAAFDLYQQWLYTGKIFINRLSRPSDDPHDFKLLVKAYLLGESVIDRDFKDTVVDCIIYKLRISAMFDPRLTTLVYEGTPTQSSLRRLWLDIYIWAGGSHWLDEKSIGDFVNGEFLLDLAKRQTGLEKSSQGPPAFMYNSCAYHEHVEGRCYRSK